MNIRFNIIPFFLILLSLKITPPIFSQNTAQNIEKNNDGISGEIYKNANIARDEGDLTKSLILYAKLAELYPESKFYADAAIQKENILHSLRQQYSTDALLRKITTTITTKQKLNGYELAKWLINSYPNEKTYIECKNAIKECLTNIILRFAVKRVSRENAALVYKGDKTVKGKLYRVFEFDNEEIIRQDGENILWFNITGKNDNTNEVSLTPINSLARKLSLNNKSESRAEITAKISNAALECSIIAEFYADYIETSTGQAYHGFLSGEYENHLYFDIPYRKAIKRIKIDKNTVINTRSYAINDNLSDTEKSFLEPSNIEEYNIKKLNQFLNYGLYPESIILFFSLTQNKPLEKNKPELPKIYNFMENKILNKTITQELFDRGNYFLNNGYIYLGWNQLNDIINSYPDDDISIKAKNILADLSKQANINFYITSVSTQNFPLLFMGYTKLNDIEELYQINHKEKSYFLEKGKSYLGYKFINSEEKTTAVFDDQLNALKKQSVRQVYVEPEEKGVITLAQGKPYSDPKKVYIEIEDRLTGKTYPGHYTPDSITTKDGSTYYGLIKHEKLTNQYHVYSGFNPKNKQIFKETDTITLNSRQSQNEMKETESLLGPIIYGDLKKYSQLDKTALSNKPNLSPDDKKKITAIKENTPKKNNIDKLNSKENLTPTKNTVSNITKKNIKNIENLKFKSRQQKIILKKRIIKLLGAVIILWLIYMGYKVIKAFK